MTTMTENIPDTDRSAQRVNGKSVQDATEHLPADQRAAILWMHAFYWDNGLGLKEAAQQINYDATTLSRVFRGQYEGNLGEVVSAIQNFKRITEERATINRPPYIETSLYREIEECANAARAYQKIGFIYGESQVGKTDAINHYATRDHYNHGNTVVVEMPVGGALVNFAQTLANRLRISGQARGSAVFEQIAMKLHPHMLLIVDEAARAVPGTRSDKTLDFIRALYDARRCGMLLVGTNIFRDQMADEKFEPFLRQLHRRVLFRRQLPDRPSRADLNLFSRHYKLPAAVGEAYELQREMIARHGLGVWLTTLAAASRNAAKRGQPMTWEHVIKARAFLKKLEEQTKVED